MAAGVRQLKRDGKLENTWTRDGYIFVKKGDCTQDHLGTGNPCFELTFVSTVIGI